MRVRTQNKINEKTETQKIGTFMLPNENNIIFFLLILIFIPAIWAIIYEEYIFSLGCILIIFVGHYILNKKSFKVKYRVLKIPEINWNLLHHNNFCHFRENDKKILKKAILYHEYTSVFTRIITNIMALSFFVLHCIYIISMLFPPWKAWFFWESKLFYIIFFMVISTIGIGLFNAYKGYQTLKNKIYSPHNNLLFLASPKEKYYYDLFKNKKWWYDYIIY